MTGFIKKFPLDVEKLGDLIAAEEYKEKCQRPNGCVSNRQRQLSAIYLLSSTGEIL